MIVLLSAGAPTAWAEEDPRQTLGILDVEFGEYTVLAPQLQHGRQRSACFARDERYVAFDAWPMTQSFNSTRLYVQDRKTEKPHRVGQSGRIAWWCTAANRTGNAATGLFQFYLRLVL